MVSLEDVKVKLSTELQYLHGFGNHHATEAIPNTLPEGQNTPQKCAHGLYAEQLSGTAFTAPRANNQFAWLYRILPCVRHLPWKRIDRGHLLSTGEECRTDPQQFRWMPLEIPKGQSVDFTQGLHTYAVSGSPETKTGLAIHLFVANTSMTDKAMQNSDGDMLFVPQQGTIYVKTEFGDMKVAPGEIFVIQRGIRFQLLHEEPIRGYICEIFGGHFKIPDLGPIGANGLANPRDFKTPVAKFENVKRKFTVVNKFIGELFSAEMDHSPFNVVAWHGVYAPYKYDLKDFCVVNAVLYDHLDPSIFTVLTCQTMEPGVAAADFVIFPPRWCVQENTFRPPYYHRNCMSEFMGLIKGQYEAKVDGGFQPGGASLHSCMTPHGPDASTFESASNADTTKPMRIPDNTLAFMFESTYMLKLSYWALNTHKPDPKYHECWQGLKDQFSDLNIKQ